MKLHPKVAAVEPYVVDCLEELAEHFTEDMSGRDKNWRCGRWP